MIDKILKLYADARDVRESTLEHYRFVARSYEKFVGHPLGPPDFDEASVNQYLRQLTESRSPWTVKQRRISIVTLWRAGYEFGFIDRLPGRIRRVRTPDRIIRTWTPHEVAHLIACAESLDGTFRGTNIPRAGFLSLWIRIGYDTGLRKSDMFELETDWIYPHARAVICQRKTRFAVAIHFRPETMAAVRGFCLRPGHGRFVFPNLWTGNHFCRAFAAFVESCGLEGSTTTLRQTSCTEVEAMAPGMGWVHLGHRSPETTRRWYVNRDRAYADRPLPPLP